jgi:CDP-glycerol glycerophosphotransferase (TagB/SpsB family)
MYNNILIVLLSKIIYLITCITPKFKWLLIQTYPIWEDNGVALYEHIRNKEIKKIIWLIPDKLEKTPFEVTCNTRFYKRNSIKGVFFYIFSKYVFITHGLYFRKFPKNQISVNMWHGMPIKRIDVEKGRDELITTFTLSTSKYFNEILSTTFKITFASILNIGLPRNIRLFCDLQLSKEKLNIPYNSKVVFWLPTYRKSVEGDIRTDGIDYGNVFNMPDFNIEQFCTLLEKLNCFCFVKAHPMSQFRKNFDYKRLKIITDNWLSEKQITLYESLAACDVLISDVSSILIDFLLTKKPVLIVFPDKEVYTKNRGFTTESFFNNIPGPLCTTFSELCIELQNVVYGVDNYSLNRNELLSLYHNKESIADPASCMDKIDDIINARNQ